MNRKAVIGTSFMINPDYGVTVRPAPASSKCDKQVIHCTCKRSQKELLRYNIFRRLATVAVEETFHGVRFILTLQLCLLQRRQLHLSPGIVNSRPEIKNKTKYVMSTKTSLILKKLKYDRSKTEIINRLKILGKKAGKGFPEIKADFLILQAENI